MGPVVTSDHGWVILDDLPSLRWATVHLPACSPSFCQTPELKRSKRAGASEKSRSDSLSSERSEASQSTVTGRLSDEHVREKESLLTAQ